MFKRCLVFVLTILCLLFSLGCGSDGGSSAQQNIEKNVSQIKRKTFFTAKEFERLSVDDLKATVEEIDKMPKSDDRKTVLKNEAIKTVALEYIEKNQSVLRNVLDGAADRIVEEKSSIVASDVKIKYFYDYDGAGHLGVRAQFKLQNVSKKSYITSISSHYLRKEGHTSFEANFNSSVLQKVLTAPGERSMKLLPGDVVNVMLDFKTDIKAKTANGWHVSSISGDVENVLFTIDEKTPSEDGFGSSQANLPPAPTTPPVASAPVKSSAPSNGSAEALKDFHYAISMKKYKDAYQYLGPEMQQYVGGYDKFVQGYQTTVYSVVRSPYVVSNDGTNAVIKYTIQAKDRTSSGDVLQDFSAESKLTKINGRWRIVDTRARKVS